MREKERLRHGNLELLRAVPAASFLAMPLRDLRRRFDQSLVYDWAMRCPIVVFSSLVLSRDILAFWEQVLHNPLLFEQPDGGTVIAMLARISQWGFVVLLSIQNLFRLRPVAKSEEILPRGAALIAVCLPLTFMLLSRAPPNIAFNFLAALVGLLANVMSVVTVSFLGRSLSIMPEARRLVQSGPYGIVRHPLYLCELLGTGAVTLQYRSLPAAGLLLLAITLQAARARWEEGVLARAFPDFAAYQDRTSFLIPPDPLRFFASFLADFAARRRLAIVAISLVMVQALVVIVLPRLMA